MPTFNALPHGLTLKKISFTLSARANREAVWLAIATVSDSNGDEWLVFGEGDSLARAASITELNMLEGKLRKPKYI